MFCAVIVWLVWVSAFFFSLVFWFGFAFGWVWVLVSLLCCGLVGPCLLFVLVLADVLAVFVWFILLRLVLLFCCLGWLWLSVLVAGLWVCGVSFCGVVLCCDLVLFVWLFWWLLFG